MQTKPLDARKVKISHALKLICACHHDLPHIDSQVLPRHVQNVVVSAYPHNQLLRSDLLMLTLIESSILQLRHVQAMASTISALEISANIKWVTSC